MRKQVCIIPFRRDFLLKFNATPQTPLEQIESIDMLRIIETGGKVRMVEMAHDTMSVDTPEDLALVRILMKNDPLRARYAD
jgi:3-deoxy-manno-octulosonate cytidylyltransferase (CMP-KDO synthetase)